VVINSAIYGGDKTSRIKGFSHDYQHPNNLQTLNPSCINDLHGYSFTLTDFTIISFSFTVSLNGKLNVPLNVSIILHQFRHYPCARIAQWTFEEFLPFVFFQ